jgi:type IV secretion system protein VirD4
MNANLKKRIRWLLMSLPLALLVVGIIEWALAFIVSWLPMLHSIKSPDQLLELLLDPIRLYQNASIDQGFIRLQIIVAMVYIYLVYAIYKKLRGPVYKAASHYGAHGTARFAKRPEIFDGRNFVKDTVNKKGYENLSNPAGLIFGLYNDKPVILPENTKIPNRNVFVIGSPGSGKTQSYILSNIIHEQERSIVVTDPKGEIYEASSELKREQGYEVRLVNFKEMSVSDRYNPIDYITKEIEAEQIANTIVLNAQKDVKPDFWMRSEVALLKTLLLYVKYEYPYNATMAKVKEILTVHGATPERMDRYFSRLHSDHPAYQSYMIVQMAEERVRASIFISLGVTLSKFDSSDVRWFTELSDFRLDDIGKRKMIVYCVLPVADSTWEPLISTFFSQMFHRLYDVADKNFNRLPVKVNLLLDEFPNLGKIPGYEEILATCRSYGISTSTIVQSLGQLIDKYSKEKAEAIVGNCSLRYLLGVGDKLTAEYFSELLGKTTVQTSSSSASKGGRSGSSGSSSQSYTQRNLLTPDELTRLPRHEAVLLVSGAFAILLRKAYQFEFFKGILNEENKINRFDYLKMKPLRSPIDDWAEEDEWEEGQKEWQEREEWREPIW